MAHVAEGERRVGLVCGSLALAALAVALFGWPIVPHDTDLFYHLNFGRKIAGSLSIPHSAWYSYVAAIEAPVDYYWLSQLSFYGLHKALGPVGLIATRAVLFLALAALLALLARRSPLGRTRPTLALCLAGTALLIVLERFTTVRPHMFSYVFLATAIVLVEQGGPALLGLAPLAVLWANFHGIEYPVLLVVLGGACADRARLLRASQPERSRARREFLWLCAAGLALLVNPFGARLLPVPFTPLGLVGQAIFELQPVKLSQLVSFSVESLLPAWDALRTSWLALALICGVAGLAQKALKPSHAVWLLAALYLLTRAQRLSMEFTLLALPVILSSSFLEARSTALTRRAPRLALFGLFGALAIARVHHVTRGAWAYPVAENFLPRGTAALLRTHAASGRVLHHPNYGGYLEWALGERFLIGTDLQTPFFFPGARVLELTAAFADARALHGAAETWRADYVLVPWTQAPSLQAGVSDRYAAVGFDDVVVAYASRERCAAFVTRFELHTLLPARLNRLLYGQLANADLAAAATELARLSEVDARVAVVHAARAMLAEQQGAHAEALVHANAAVALAPGHLESLRIAGEIALANGSASAALPHFARGLELATSTSAPSAARSRLALGAARALTELGRARETYALILPAFADLTDSSVSADDLKLLAAAAGDADEPAAASTLAHLAAIRAGGASGQP